MRRAFKYLLLVVCLSLCAVAAWQRARERSARSEAAPRPIYAAVYSHFRALRAADPASAYRQVSTAMQQNCNILQFSDKVRCELADLAHSARIEFGAVHVRNGRAVVRVFLTDQNGRVTPCIYQLVRESDGWKIDQVRLQKPWPRGRRLGGLET